MLRIRDVPPLPDHDVPAPQPTKTKTLKRVRLGVFGAVGAVLGVGGMMLTVSLVKAGDDAGVRAFILEEAAKRAVLAPRASAYAPAGIPMRLPLVQTNPDGRIAHPPVNLQVKKRSSGKKSADANAHYDTVSGAANVARTICVRLCDGYHMPIGHLRSQSDMPAHEALCTALNPGIPVKVFRVAAGAESIDGATASDGKTYGSLPVAYSHETSADTACRPAIATAEDRRVSLLRDFTLRPGDAIVLDGKVTTFEGSSSWPYTARNFRDFRNSRELSARERRTIDAAVGVSRREGQIRSFRKQMRVDEAKANAATVALRGQSDTAPAGTNTTVVRHITIDPET
ncbi:DUF2865 domain-containing protein [Bosea sp. (in: a-proteobacteria)]|jgi:hypothetical protein|uniref:DUF2865 domain-containing protein n=1 Tax=Bosea sp. (in: a-proteobacteria) TaxID=1871050 RepID=UPI003F70358D